MKKLVSLVALSFLLVACSTKQEQTTSSSQPSEQATVASQDKKDVLDLTLKDKDGNDVKLSDYKGKKVYLNVWASWCGPCQQEMPELEEVYQAYKDKDDYAFLSLTSPNDKVFGNSNPADGSKKEILKTARKAGVTYPILFDTKDKAMSSLNISAFPTHYLINSDGTVDKVYLGRISKADLKTFLEELE